MSKALFEGCGSYGTIVQMATENGKDYFVRHKERTRWGYAWSRWSKTGSPTWATEIRSSVEFAGSDEIINKVEPGLIIEHGFALLRKVPYFNVRLPKSA